VWEVVLVSFQDEGVWIICSQVECRNGGVKLDAVEVFVVVDSGSCMSGGGGEREHEVRDGVHSRVQNLEATGIQAELCDGKGMMREGGRGGADVSSDRKRVKMWLVAAVRGPFQSVQSVGGGC